MEMVSATFLAIIVFTLTVCIKRAAVRLSGIQVEANLRKGEEKLKMDRLADHALTQVAKPAGVTLREVCDE